jgi:hypothetical protein
MTPFVTAGAGFLLAVLWFDLMHDVQVLNQNSPSLPEVVLASITGYYRRVTRDARPMNRLVALAMLGTLAAIVTEIARGETPAWAAWTSFGLAGAPILLASIRTVPNAVRLGGRSDSAEVQSRLARTICREHFVCLASIAALLAVQLGFGR